jgi:hypothetical protein
MTTIGFHARLDPELHASVRDAASDQGVSMNELISQVLADYVQATNYVLKLRVIETPDGWLEYSMEIPDGLHDGTGLVDRGGEKVTGKTGQE